MPRLAGWKAETGEPTLSWDLVRGVRPGCRDPAVCVCGTQRDPGHRRRVPRGWPGGPSLSRGPAAGVGDSEGVQQSSVAWQQVLQPRIPLARQQALQPRLPLARPPAPTAAASLLSVPSWGPGWRGAWCWAPEGVHR